MAKTRRPTEPPKERHKAREVKVSLWIPADLYRRMQLRIERERSNRGRTPTMARLIRSCINGSMARWERREGYRYANPSEKQLGGDIPFATVNSITIDAIAKGNFRVVRGRRLRRAAKARST